MTRTAVGIFAINSGGFGPGVIQNFDSAESQPVNTSRITARPGQAVTVWATGLGPVASDRDAPTAADTTLNVEMFVGGRAARRLYAGRSPCCSGLDQLVFVVPDDAPQGCHVPVQVRAGGVVSNTVAMAIARQGSRCGGAANSGIETLSRGGKLGVILSNRYRVLVDVDPLSPYETETDSLTVSFREERETELFSNPVFLTPPAGSCLTYSLTGDLLSTSGKLPAAPGIRELDAGTSMTLQGSAGSLSVPQLSTTSKVYGRLMSGDSTAFPLQFNLPGSFRVSGTGGANVGPFTATVSASARPTWTNRDSISEIRRGEALTIRWSGVDASKQAVMIHGIGVDVRSNASSAFSCVADAAAGAFTVPDYVLANLPVSAGQLGRSDALLLVGAGSLAGPEAFTAGGVDHTLASQSSWVGRTVSIKPEAQR